jgi:hypothetical protein
VVSNAHVPLAGSDNVRKLVSGGDPMFLDSPITLCGRVDLNAERFFSGRLAELSIFDNSLTKQQVTLQTDVCVHLSEVMCQATCLSVYQRPFVGVVCRWHCLDACRWRTSILRASAA